MSNERSWYPEDYASNDKIYVYRMTWENEEVGEYMNYKEVITFIVDVMVNDEAMTSDEAKEILANGGTVRIGPDEDWYKFTPLDEPMVMDRYGEIVTVQQRDDELNECNDRGVKAGVDYPGSM